MVPIKALFAAKVAAERAKSGDQTSGLKMVKRLFLNRVYLDAGCLAVKKGNIIAVNILTRQTKARPAWGNPATAGTNITG